jgi:Transglutaminase-like superfamily
MQVWDTDLGTVRRLGPRLVWLFAEAFAALAFARLALLVLPFRRLAPRLGNPVAASQAGSGGLAGVQLQTVREVAWAIRAASARMPIDAACLTQAYAGRILLRRRGIPAVLHLGLATGLEGKDTSDISLTAAHAWLEAGGAKVTGYPLDPSLVEVAAFA